MKKMETLELRELQDDVDAKAEKLVIKPFEQADLGGHNHNFFELAYVTGGTTIHTLNDIRSTLTKGDYFIVDYGSVHSYKESKDLKLINCLFLPEIINDTLKGCNSFEMLIHGCLLRYYKIYLGKSTVNHIFHDEDGRVLELLLGMMKEYQERKIGFNEIFRCRLLEILIITMRKLVDDKANISTNKAIIDAMEFINRNFTEQKLLDRFCKEYHFTPQYISRKFKEETGFTISEYLQKIRMEKCCELLAGSDLPISEIAQEIGYSDMKFFNKIFKRMLKMSPREYRKTSRQREYRVLD